MWPPSFPFLFQSLWHPPTHIIVLISCIFFEALLFDQDTPPSQFYLPPWCKRIHCFCFSSGAPPPPPPFPSSSFNNVLGVARRGEVWITSRNEFSDSECPNINIGYQTIHKSLQNCKDLCLETARCTAFNYNRMTTSCVMRGCSLPVVPPANDIVRQYDGFWLSSTSLIGT